MFASSSILVVLLLPALLLSLLLPQVHAVPSITHPLYQRLPNLTRQETCSSSADCPDTSPFIRCVRNRCTNLRDLVPTIPPSSTAAPTEPPVSDRPRPGGSCRTITDCPSGLICVATNPGGTCEQSSGMFGIATFVINLIQQDYTPSNPNSGPTPQQAGPTVTSRAMAIIHLAAHEAFAVVSGQFSPNTNRPPLRSVTIRLAVRLLNEDERLVQAEAAMQAAALSAAKRLYPNLVRFIDPVFELVTAGAQTRFVQFGEDVGNDLFESRLNDGSGVDQLDDEFEIGVLLRHQPDPNFPIVQGDPNARQENFGRTWGQVTPFVIRDVERDANLERFPDLPSQEYRDNLAEVDTMGECNDFTNDDGVLLQDIGIFWGYDGAPEIGVPPRLFLQTVLAIKDVQDLSLPDSVRALTGVTVAMADAGIAAWFWKFFYDLWRPTIGVRNDTISPDPEWNPRGIPLSNRNDLDNPPECVGVNPDFPAYPSGHASFGAACFVTLANILGKEPSELVATITSDEFNGNTVESTTGETRRVFTQTINLQEAIEQNNAGRVYLGVHWRFDSDGGELVGRQIADIAADQFDI